MKTLILENEHEDFIPKEVLAIAEKKFPGFEKWGRFNIAFWPENREAALARLASLKDGDNLLMKHVFHGYFQLEMMIVFLDQMATRGTKLNLYLVRSLVLEELIRYLDQEESELCPCGSKGWPMGMPACESFKKEMNIKLLRALEFHCIYDVSDLGMDRKDWQKRITVDTINEELEERRKNCKHTIMNIVGRTKVCNCGYVETISGS